VGVPETIMAAPQQAFGADRRTERRMRALKHARIIFNKGYGVFDCTVRNISPGGALLDVPSMLGIPSHFDIVMDATNARRPCTVRWHTDHLIGVHFDDVAPDVE
jgi:hypothetical protein